MWQGQLVSVIFPTYNEKDSICAAVDDFFASGYVDEVLVINNNAAEGTSEEVAKTKAREIMEPKQGYGAAIQRGLAEAKGQLLIIAEPDGTFVGRDVVKLLAYSEEFDYVLGTRTTHEYIWEGANMDFSLKWGNVLVAKIMEVLFSSSILTDMGCTLRLIHREAYLKIRSRFTVTDSHFGPEMTMIVLTSELSLTEIPVNYERRVGTSSVTGSKIKAIKLGFVMLWLIMKMWVQEKLLKRNRRIPSTQRRSGVQRPFLACPGALPEPPEGEPPHDAAEAA